MGFLGWRLISVAFAAVVFFHGCCVSEIAPNYTFVHQATTAPKISYYDYIIVGGGTAGCPLAATLSEKYNVLLLERGGAPYGNSNITDLTSFGASLSDLSPSSPSQRFISEDGVISARARVLGGGSCLNAGFYTRASTQYVQEAATRVQRIYCRLSKCAEYTPRTPRIQPGLTSKLCWKNKSRRTKNPYAGTD